MQPRLVLARKNTPIFEPYANIPKNTGVTFNVSYITFIAVLVHSACSGVDVERVV
jgi:hypothetical protein